MLAFNTGLAEVSLPIEYRLKNIEETEAAKRKLLEDRRILKQKKSDGNSITVSTLSLGYSAAGFDQQYSHFFLNKKTFQNKSDDHWKGKHDDNIQSSSVHKNQSSSSTIVSRPKGMEQRTDDLVMDRFKKRQRLYRN